MTTTSRATDDWHSAVLVLTPSGSLVASQGEVTPHRLCSNFAFLGIYRSQAALRAAMPLRDERCFIIRPLSLEHLLSSFTHFKALDYLRIFECLGITLNLRTVKAVALRHLRSISDPPTDLVYVFKTLIKSRRVSVKDPTDPQPADRERKRRERATETPDDTAKRRKLDAAAHRARAESASLRRRLQAVEDQQHARSSFPQIASDNLKHNIIADFQQHVHPARWSSNACAVCRSLCYGDSARTVPVECIDLSLLRNPSIPVSLLPTEYDLDLYQHAILYPPGMTDRQSLAPLNVCQTCANALLGPVPHLPEFALANFYYYATSRLPPAVKDAFTRASPFELMLVARYRCSRITYRFSENKSKTLVKGNPALSQCYSKGNTIILPQDPSGVRDVLPPSSDEINAAMCALFVGSGVPTKETVGRFEPVLVSKSRVKILLDFLLTENSFYRSATTFSQANFDALFTSSDVQRDRAALQHVEIAHLPYNASIDPTSSDNTERYSDLDRPEGDDTLLMESVGYTDGDYTPQNYRDMKAKALSWVKRGKPFIQSRAGSTPMCDRDEDFLTSVFPHLDPYGIGGLMDKRRSSNSSLLRQVRYLVGWHDSPFERDANFAYICWNIIQKSEVNKSMSFRIKESERLSIVHDIESLPASSIDGLIAKWEKNPMAKASTPEEKLARRILRRLHHVSSSLTGSAGELLIRRNEIRGVMNVRGVPTFFLTITPSDIGHPLVRVLSGDEMPIETFMRGETMDKFHRALLAAKRPALAAKFFDIMMTGFIEHVLRPGDPNGGLLGKCLSYYGIVEAQGRGTLHDHMMVWIEGNLNPQALRDRLADDAEFKARMFSYLDDLISTSLPGSNTVATLEECVRPKRPFGSPHPSAIYMPQIKEFESFSSFSKPFNDSVRSIVTEVNWHIHSETCWKYLEKGEPRDDQHCRMRMDGLIRPVTEIDEESGAIVLRRLHPKLNNHNMIIAFLMQSNTDLKHIGSGEAAKALTYYATDYMTKASLPVHVGLAAVQYAIKRNEEKFANDSEAPQAVQSKSLLTKSVNAMMARIEVSHAQIMSHFVGHGNYYTNETFRNLYWGTLDRFVRAYENKHPTIPTLHASRDCADSDILDNNGSDTENDADGCEDVEEEVILRFKGHSVTATNQLSDYRFRPKDTIFNDMCPWDYIAGIERLSIADDAQRPAPPAEGETRSGRRPNARGRFSSAEHPQFETHMVRLRDRPVIPVMLGPTIPRHDKSRESREQFCRAALILFKPWRSPSDLKPPNVTWTEAFDCHEFSTEHLNVLHNMNVQHECKDARDAYTEARRTSRTKGSLIEGSHVNADFFTDDNEGRLADALLGDATLDGMSDIYDSDSDVEEVGSAGRHNADSDLLKEPPIDKDLQRAISLLTSTLPTISAEPVVVSSSSDGAPNAVPVIDTTFTQADDDDLVTITGQERHMKLLKKMGKPSRVPRETINVPDALGESSSSKATGTRIRLPETTCERVLLNHPADLEAPHYEIQRQTASPSEMSPLTEVERIIDDFGLQENAEQNKAFRIIAEHFLRGSDEQLTFYLGGIGGTGKSHVVNAVVALFNVCGLPDSLQVSAPTGIAAVLIRGHTIHSLTLLPKSVHRSDPHALEEIWMATRWLILDEVSMIGALLFSQISHQISLAKGNNPAGKDSPFGHVNVIQRRFRAIASETFKGQSALHGAYLWRMQVTRHVELVKNWRHAEDEKYANLVSRIRVGQAWTGKQPHTLQQRGTGNNYHVADYDVILGRTLEHLFKAGGKPEEWEDAPFIVSRKNVRDVLNLFKVKETAGASSKNVWFMAAQDFIGKRCATDVEQRRLLRLSSSKTKDALGWIPMVEDMPVMVTENLVLSHSVVNGAEGRLKSVKYTVGDDGQKNAVCAYVKIDRANVAIDPMLHEDIVPITPTKTQFMYKGPNGSIFKVTRLQLPLVPAYAYTDYKSQGRGLKKAIIDLLGCRSLQSLYVMLSRVTHLTGLAVLRWFTPNKMQQNLQQELRDELHRLQTLDAATDRWYSEREPLTAEDVHFSIQDSFEAAARKKTQQR